MQRATLYVATRRSRRQWRICHATDPKTMCPAAGHRWCEDLGGESLAVGTSPSQAGQVGGAWSPGQFQLIAVMVPQSRNRLRTMMAIVVTSIRMLVRRRLAMSVMASWSRVMRSSGMMANGMPKDRMICE